MSDVLALARPDLVALPGYRAAVQQPGLTRLHANEMPWRGAGDRSTRGLNRYPPPQPPALTQRLASLYATRPDRILVTRGSDDGIDLLVRAHCRAGVDAVQVCPPTFEMYRHAAELQGAPLIETPLEPHDFALRPERVLADAARGAKLLFLCSPNNPSGNRLDGQTIRRLASELDGRTLIVVDEAYQEFAVGQSAIDALDAHDNLVVLRTLSKAHALAGARCGVLLAHPALIGLLRRLMPPYPLPEPTVRAAMRALEPAALCVTRKRIDRLRRARDRLHASLAALPGVRRVWPSEANFLLIEADEPAELLARGLAAGLLLRDLSDRPGLRGCIRITVGSAGENAALLQALHGRADPARRAG